MKPDGALPILRPYYYTMMTSRIAFEIRLYRKVINDHFDNRVCGETSNHADMPTHKEREAGWGRQNEAGSTESSKVKRDPMALVIQWSLTENLLYMDIVLAAWETSKNLVIMIHA